MCEIKEKFERWADELRPLLRNAQREGGFRILSEYDLKHWEKCRAAVESIEKWWTEHNATSYAITKILQKVRNDGCVPKNVWGVGVVKIEFMWYCEKHGVTHRRNVVPC